RPCRQFTLQPGVLPLAAATYDDLAIAVNLNPQPLGTLVSEGYLLQQRQPARIRDVVIGQDRLPQPQASRTEISGWRGERERRINEGQRWIFCHDEPQCLNVLLTSTRTRSLLQSNRTT